MPVTTPLLVLINECLKIDEPYTALRFIQKVHRTLLEGTITQDDAQAILTVYDEVCHLHNIRTSGTTQVESLCNSINQ